MTLASTARLLAFSTLLGSPLAAQNLVFPGALRAPNTLDAELSHSFGSELRGLGSGFGDVAVSQAKLDYSHRFMLGPKTGYSLGLGSEAFAFDLPGGVALPNHVQSIYAKLGYSMRFENGWFLAAEINPGVYSDFQDVDGDDFTVPFGVFGGYRFSEQLDLIFGVRVDFWSDLPVMGGLGLRWKPDETWTVNLGLPRAYVDYALTGKAGIFAAGDWKSGSFRVADDLGDDLGLGQVNGEVLEYREIRAGGGFRYYLTDGIAALLEAGWTFDRKFEYEDVGVSYDSEGAPYAGLGIYGRF